MATQWRKCDGFLYWRINLAIALIARTCPRATVGRAAIPIRAQSLVNVPSIRPIAAMPKRRRGAFNHQCDDICEGRIDGDRRVMQLTRALAFFRRQRSTCNDGLGWPAVSLTLATCVATELFRRATPGAGGGWENRRTPQYRFVLVRITA
jgi:hypothetical protein